jgi:hypothetical protein
MDTTKFLEVGIVIPMEDYDLLMSKGKVEFIQQLQTKMLKRAFELAEIKGVSIGLKEVPIIDYCEGKAQFAGYMCFRMLAPILQLPQRANKLMEN